MSVPHEKQQDQQTRIVAFLAQDSDVPIADVAKIFEHELAKLTVGARITGFLNIFVMRHVQEILRYRSAEKRTAIVVAQVAGGPIFDSRLL